MKNYLSRELYGINHLSEQMKILPNPQTLFGGGADYYRILRNLTDDPHVWSCVQSRKSGVVGSDYSIDSGGAPEKIAGIITEMINSLDVLALSRACIDGVLYGFTPFELVWKLENGRFRPIKLVQLGSEYFTFNPEGTLLFNGRKGPEPVPDNKVIIASHEANPLNPYGKAVLASCYWPVKFKSGGAKYWVNYMERYGMPLIIGHFERGAGFDEARKLADELSSLADNTVIVAPSDIDIDLKEAARGSSVSLFRELINHCNSEISKAILSQTLTTEIGSGSYAAAQTHYRIRRELLLSDSAIIEKFFNSLIESIVDLNFPGSAYPKFNHLAETADITERADRDIKLSSLKGFQFTKEYWIKNYGFEDSDIIID
ncbi:MAG: DUF935 family protein [Candidatus Kapaibacterium sp.]